MKKQFIGIMLALSIINTTPVFANGPTGRIEIALSDEYKVTSGKNLATLDDETVAQIKEFWKPYIDFDLNSEKNIIVLTVSTDRYNFVDIALNYFNMKFNYGNHIEYLNYDRNYDAKTGKYMFVSYINVDDKTRESIRQLQEAKILMDQDIQYFKGLIQKDTNLDEKDLSKFYNYIVLRYTYRYSDNVYENSAYNFSKLGIGACEQAAQVVDYELNKMGIKCYIIRGSVDNGQLHSWNVVDLNGKIYSLDTTFGNTSSERNKYLAVDDTLKFGENRSILGIY